jgi:hypothetical protein
MARYTDTDKAKKKTGGSSRGYGTDPKPSGGYDAGYVAKPEPTTREVDIQVYADMPGDDGKQPLAGVEVTLASEGDTPHFEDIQTTGNDGRVSWRDLSPGHYTATAAPPEGFAAPAAQEVDLSEEDQKIEIDVEPEPAIVRVLVYHDARGTCDPTGQEAIGPVPFEIWKGGKRLGSYSTKPNGCAEVHVKQFGMISVRAQQKMRLGQQSYQLPSSAPMMVQATPGKVSEVHAGYQLQPAELEVVATFSEAGQLTVPLPGVTINLYSGPVVTGDPIRQRPAPYIFSDLSANTTYMVVATPPQSFHGDTVEPLDPPGGAMQVTLLPGQNRHEFSFQRSLGKLIGYVYTAVTLEPLPQIALLLSPRTGGASFHAWTGVDGAFTFTNLPPGCYDLAFEESKVTTPDGRKWVPAGNRPLKVPVQIASGKLTNLASPLLMELDEHLLTVHVVGPDGKPAPFVQFEVFDEQNNQLGPFGVGEDGTKTLPLPKAGTYHVGLSTFDNGEPRRFPNAVCINPRGETTLQIQGPKAGHRHGIPGGGPTETTIDIPYPLITESASMGGGSWGSPAPPSSADLGQTVQDALRSVLNWRSAGFNGDAKGFVAALNQSFTLTQTQGHTEFTWTPRSYAAVQSGLGALTGAQASIYTRAKAALDQALPLLEGLYPLLSSYDPQIVEANRAIVRSGLTELVNEFGIEGGPRVLRVDDLFRQLVGPAIQTNPENVGGQLKQLSDSFGLLRAQVNTIDEEQDLTNFFIIVDYTLGLQQSWLTQRGSFTRSASSHPFLGTQLVLVERSLAVVAESVQEIYMALDSVFVGKEERQVVELTLPPFPGDTDQTNSSLFVAELLGWIDQVASNEGPQLIKDGGKQGVISFQDTIGRLAFLASNALLQPQLGMPTGLNLPKGYRTARVQNALSELAVHLNETSNLVLQIQAS